MKTNRISAQFASDIDAVVEFEITDPGMRSFVVSHNLALENKDNFKVTEALLQINAQSEWIQVGGIEVTGIDKNEARIDFAPSAVLKRGMRFKIAIQAVSDSDDGKDEQDVPNGTFFEQILLIAKDAMTDWKLDKILIMDEEAFIPYLSYFLLNGSYRFQSCRKDLGRYSRKHLRYYDVMSRAEIWILARCTVAAWYEKHLSNINNTTAMLQNGRDANRVRESAMFAENQRRFEAIRAEIERDISVYEISDC